MKKLLAITLLLNIYAINNAYSAEDIEQPVVENTAQKPLSKTRVSKLRNNRAQNQQKLQNNQQLQSNDNQQVNTNNNVQPNQQVNAQNQLESAQENNAQNNLQNQQELNFVAPSELFNQMFANIHNEIKRLESVFSNSFQQARNQERKDLANVSIEANKESVVVKVKADDIDVNSQELKNMKIQDGVLSLNIPTKHGLIKVNANNNLIEVSQQAKNQQINQAENQEKAVSYASSRFVRNLPYSVNLEAATAKYDSNNNTLTVQLPKVATKNLAITHS